MLLSLFETKEKYQTAGIVILIFLVSLMEMISVLALMPFIKITLGSNELALQTVQSYFGTIQSIDEGNIKLLASAIFIGLLVVTFLMRSFTYLINMNFIFRVSKRLGKTLFDNVIRQNFSYHMRVESNNIISALYKVDEVIFYQILPFFNVLTACLLSLALIIVFASIATLEMSLIVLALGTTYFIISKLNKAKISKNSRIVASSTSELVKNLQEALGSIRDVFILSSQSFFENRNQSIISSLRNSQCSTQVRGMLPRFFFEAAGLISIAILTLVVAKNNRDLPSVIAELSIFSICLMRLLPTFQSLFNASIVMRGSKESLIEVLKLINSDQRMDNHIDGQLLRNFKKLHLESATFDHLSGENVFKDLNLEVFRGQRVVIIGESGSGKTTLLDVMMGLLNLSGGDIFINDEPLNSYSLEAYYSKISCVSQTSFLLNDNIANNIAFPKFGQEIDSEKLNRAISLASLEETILNFPNGVQTIVGEAGKALSGGQRQRIAIARALYQDAELIFFDEPTSALDTDTAASVISSILELPSTVTVVVVTHDRSIISKFDQVLDLSDRVQ